VSHSIQPIFVRIHISGKSCTYPGIPRNGYKHGSSYLAGDVVTFTCNDCYRLVGYSKITCLRSGSWSHSKPRCACKSSTHCWCLKITIAENLREIEYFLVERQYIYENCSLHHVILLSQSFLSVSPDLHQCQYISVISQILSQYISDNISRSELMDRKLCDNKITWCKVQFS
jgi:hypothetical protein